MRISPAIPHEPDVVELESATRALEAAGDVQGVIRLVETWERAGTVTLGAALAQARAFLALRLMDRAWVRLREAAQLSPESPDVLALTARVFIDRGWPGRARKLVDQLSKLDPSHADLALLKRQVVLPAQGPPPDARGLERSADAAQLLDLAETYLATGSFLRAKSILERVRRVDPMNPRVELLLWGLQGDFVPRGRTLGDLVADVQALGDWDGSDHTESVLRSDIGHVDPPTAEVTRATLVAAGLAEPSGPDGFPSLFRQVEGLGGVVLGAGIGDDEVTIASGLATPAQLLDPPVAERTDPGMATPDDGGEGGDTQIMQVIAGPGGSTLAPVDGPIHTSSPTPGAASRSDGPGLKETLNLRAWQESMGMGGSAGSGTLTSDNEDAGSDAGFLEAEDEDLVVMTRREGGDLHLQAEPRRAGPIEVIENHPQPLSLQTPSPPVAPATDVSAEHLDTVASAEEPELDRSLPAQAFAGARPWSRGLLVVLLMALTMTAATSLVVHYLHVAAAQQQISDAERVLAAGDYGGLLALEARLDTAVSAKAEPLEARALALAMVEAALWGDYTGNPAQRSRATEALMVAVDHGASGPTLALAEGTLSLMDGDLSSAAKHSTVAGLQSESARYLAARIALSSGDAAAAAAVYQGTSAEDSDGVRYRLLRLLSLRASQGAPVDAVDAVDAGMAELVLAAPDNALVAVAAMVSEHPPDPEQVDAYLDRVSAVIERFGDGLAPRQLASLHVARARALGAAGRRSDALDAWQRAASLDRSGETALYNLGAWASQAHSLDEAEDDLARCVEFNPFSARCRRGLVQVRVDLDHLDEAAEVAAAWGGLPADETTLAAWVALARGEGDSVLDGLVGVVEAGEGTQKGVAIYLLGVALTHQDGGDARAQRALELAQQTLQSTGDPLDRVLAARAAARRALTAVPDQLETRRREALAIAPEDPGVHILLAQRYEADGRRAAARQHLDRATGLCPQSALAWYAQGQFLFAPATMKGAIAAWRRYLDGAPSGPRAERVRSKLN